MKKLGVMLLLATLALGCQGVKPPDQAEAEGIDEAGSKFRRDVASTMSETARKAGIAVDMTKLHVAVAQGEDIVLAIVPTTGRQAASAFLYLSFRAPCANILAPGFYTSEPTTLESGEKAHLLSTLEGRPVISLPLSPAPDLLMGFGFGISTSPHTSAITCIWIEGEGCYCWDLDEDT